MSESAIAVPVVPDDESDRSAGGGVREAVLAGLGALAELDEAVRTGLFERLASSAAVRAALVKAGHVDRRRRLLPGETTVKVVLGLGLGLFSGAGYDSVLATVLPALPGALPPGTSVPTASALSQARVRVAPAVFELLFQLGATGSSVDAQTASADWACEFGLELTAFDGTTVDLADTDEIARVFATPTGGAIRRPAWSPWWSAAPVRCAPPRSAPTPPASRTWSTTWPTAYSRAP